MKIVVAKLIPSNYLEQVMYQKFYSRLPNLSHRPQRKTHLHNGNPLPQYSIADIKTFYGEVTLSEIISNRTILNRINFILRSDLLFVHQKKDMGFELVYI